MVYYVTEWPTILNHLGTYNGIPWILSLPRRSLFCVVDAQKLIIYSQQNLVQNFHFSKLQTSDELIGQISCCRFNEDGTILGIGTDLGYVLIFKTNFNICTHENDLLNGLLDEDEIKVEWPSALTRISISQFTGTISCITFFEDKYVVATSTGLVQFVHLNEHNQQDISFPIASIPFFHDAEHSKARGISDPTIYCVAMVWAPTFGGFVTLLSSGDLCLLRFQLDETIMEQNLEGIWAEKYGHAVSLAVNYRFRVTAVGLTNSEIALYRIDETTGAILIQQHLRVSSREYPDAAALVGTASQLAWSTDGYALAVAWGNCGWALWSVSGGLLYTSLGERVGLAGQLRLTNLAWSNEGSQLMAYMSITNTSRLACATENLASSVEPSAGPVTETKNFLAVFHLARSALTTNPTSDNHRHLVLQTAERVLFANRAQLTKLRSPHILNLPAMYLKHNWPLRFVGVNSSGTRIAVAGSHGLAHYNCFTQKWHVFGNEVQERSISAQGGIVWWRQYICLCCRLLNDQHFEVRMYPCEQRLDDQFVVQHAIRGSANPLLVDCYQDLFTTLTNDGRVHVFCLNESSYRNKRNHVEITAVQIIDLTNLIQLPACVVRLCLSTLTANLPSTRDSADVKRNRLDPLTSASTSATPTSASMESAGTKLAHQPEDDNRDLLHPNVRIYLSAGNEPPKSLVLNYAGRLFILQPSRVTDQDEEEEERLRQADHRGPRSYVRPLLLTPFLIASGVELVWSTSVSKPSEDAPDEQVVVDDSPQNPILRAYIAGSLWLYCGSSGLQVWLPLLKLSPTSPPTLLSREPSGYERQISLPLRQRHSSRAATLTPGYVSRRVMLSIDLDECVHPLTILFDDALLVGVLNDFHRPWALSTHRIAPLSSEPGSQSTCGVFTVIPYGVYQLDTHAFLHRLIQELLKRNLGVHALQLASAYESLPHFHRVLEWLLHEVLESEATSNSPIPDPLLPQVVAFIQEFPHFLETVAQCARKTEVARWPHLFTAVGRRPKDLFELCVECGNLHTAAAYLIILQSCEPIGVSQKCTLHLIQAAVDASRWCLIRDILRFLNAIDPNDLKYDESVAESRRSIVTGQSPNMSKQLTSVEATVELHNGPTVQTRRPSTFKSPGSTTALSSDHNNSLVESTGSRARLSSKSDGDSIANPPNQALADLIKQVFTRTASNLFAQGQLKQLAELVVNLTPYFGGHQDALAKWIASQSSNLHKLPDWSASLMKLHEQFNWPFPAESCLNGNETDEAERRTAGEACDTIQQSNSTPVSQQQSAVRRQLRFLLSQLLQAGSFEWASLVALMILDRTGLFHAITLAVDAATQCTLQRLRHRSSSGGSATTVHGDSAIGPRSSTGRAASLWRRVTGHQPQSKADVKESNRTLSQTNSVFGDPLSRVFAGLHQLDSWSMDHCLAYHLFLDSLQPELDQLVEQATSFFSQCASGTQPQSPPVTLGLPLSSPNPVAYVQVDSTTPELKLRTTNLMNGHMDEPISRIEQVQLVACENPLSDTDGSENSRSESQSHQDGITLTGLQRNKSIQSLPHPVKSGAVVHSLESANSVLSVGQLTLSSLRDPVLPHFRRTTSEDWTETGMSVELAEQNYTSSMHILNVNSDVIYADEHVVDGTSEVSLQHTSNSDYGCILS